MVVQVEVRETNTIKFRWPWNVNTVFCKSLDSSQNINLHYVNFNQ